MTRTIVLDVEPGGVCLVCLMPLEQGDEVIFDEAHFMTHVACTTEICGHGINGIIGEDINVSCPKCLFENPTVVVSCLVIASGGTSEVEWIPVDQISNWMVRTPSDARSTLEIIVNGNACLVYTPNPHGLARAIAEARIDSSD